MNITDYVIITDFDGTITNEDSNTLLEKMFGNAKSAEIEAAYTRGEKGGRETTEEHFKIINITQEEYYSFLDANIQVDPEFDAFLNLALSRNAHIYIVSGGYKQAIEHLLGKDRLTNVVISANELIEVGNYIKPKFAFDKVECSEVYGSCGNCKRLVIESIRKAVSKKLIYIGDGLTDRCAIKCVDFVFAKDTLISYCEEQNIPFKQFESFADITKCFVEK